MRKRIAVHCLLGLSMYLHPATGAHAAETEVKRLPVVFGEGQGMDTSNQRLRLGHQYRQDGGEPLFMEAERATVLRLQPAQGRILRDQDASGGLCVTWAEHIEFHFEINEPGQYTAWYRGQYPSEGSWLHFENMDGGSSATVADHAGGPVERWTWTKGPTYDLAKGKHTWNFTPSGWWGGARLDQVALVKAPATPPDAAGGKALRSTCATAEVQTEEVRRGKLLRWDKFSMGKELEAGVAAVEYSADQGRSWKTLPENGDLAAVPPDQGVTFKIKLQSGQDGMSPYITSADVTCFVEKIPELVLENPVARLRFSGENGALLGIRNVATKTDYMLPDSAAPLFSFVVMRGEYGPTKETHFAQAQLTRADRSADGQELRLAYELMGGGVKADVKIRLEPNGVARFSMSVANQSIYKICRVRFPDLRGLRVGAEASDDLLLTPILSGGIAKYPASLRLPRMSYADRALFYPGMAYMCWMDLWDEAGGGLYVAYEDREYRTTELVFAASGLEAEKFGVRGQADPPSGAGEYKRLSTPGQSIDIGYIKDIRIDADTGPVTMPDMVLGVHAGDWHWGADRYREWAQGWMRKAKVPDWFMDTDGWSVGHMTWLGTFAELAKERGRDDAHREKYGVKTPPYPVWYFMAQKEEMDAGPMSINRILGTDEMFQAGIQKQHELGHRMMFYVLPPAFTPGFNREAKRLGPMPARMVPDDEVPPKSFYQEIALRNFDGALTHPDGVYQYHPVCMGAAKWQDYLYHMIYEKYARHYGADGLYLDGMGLCSYQCANLRHGHAGYGEWLQGFTKLMGRIKPATEAERPGAIYVGEGCGDVENQYLDSGLFYFDNSPQVYRYTIPWTVGTILDTPSDSFKDYPADLSWYELITVFGLKAWGLNGYNLSGEQQREEILEFRRKFSQFQTRARFMDEVGLRIGDAAVKGKLYQRDEPGAKGALAVFFNPRLLAGTPAVLSAAAAGDVKAAWQYTLDGELSPLAFRKADGQIEFNIPSSRLSAVLLIERCEPFISISHIEPVVPGESGVATVTVRNLEAAPIAGEVMLELPKDWQTSPVEFKLDSGRSAEFALAFNVAPTTRHDVHDIYAVAREKVRLTKRCLPMGVCRPVRAELYYLAGDTIQLEMENASGRPARGAVNVTAPDGVTVDPQVADFDLPPKGKGALVFKLGNVKSVVSREFIKATLTYGKDETVAYELVQPPLLNGGFEQDQAGVGKPDYFNYRQPDDPCLSGVALDRTIFAEGRQSLRLDPYDKAAGNTLSTTYVRLVPNRKYRISCQIRRSANHPGIGARLFSMCANPKVKGVNARLGFKSEGPTGVWEKFAAEFSTPNILVPHQLALANSTSGAATVWFDDIVIEELGNP